MKWPSILCHDVTSRILNNSDTYKGKCVHEVLFNRLVKLAQEKVWLGERTIAVDWDVTNKI